MKTNIRGILFADVLAIGTAITPTDVTISSVGNELVASNAYSSVATGFNFAFGWGDTVTIKAARLFSNIQDGLVPTNSTSDKTIIAAGGGTIVPRLSNVATQLPPDGIAFTRFALPANIGDWIETDHRVVQDQNGNTPIFLGYKVPTTLSYKTDLIDSRLNGIMYHIGLELLVEHAQPLIWS